MTEQENLKVFEYPDFFEDSEGRSHNVYIASKSASAAARALDMPRWTFVRRATELGENDDPFTREFVLASPEIPWVEMNGTLKEAVFKQEEEETLPEKSKASKAKRLAKIYALVVSLYDHSWDELLDDLWRDGIKGSSHRDFIQMVARELSDLE